MRLTGSSLASRAGPCPTAPPSYSAEKKSIVPKANLRWMDDFLHHFETMVEAIACWYVQGNQTIPGFLRCFCPSTAGGSFFECTQLPKADLLILQFWFIFSQGPQRLTIASPFVLRCFGQAWVDHLLIQNNLWENYKLDCKTHPPGRRWQSKSTGSDTKGQCRHVLLTWSRMKQQSLAVGSPKA